MSIFKYVRTHSRCLHHCTWKDCLKHRSQRTALKIIMRLQLGITPKGIQVCKRAKHILNSAISVSFALRVRFSNKPYLLYIRWVWMTTLPLSYVDFLEVWEIQPRGTLRARPGLYRDCFTFFFLSTLHKTLWPHSRYISGGVKENKRKLFSTVGNNRLD